MVTVGGLHLKNLEADNFEFSLMKSGKKIKATMPQPVKSKTGNWILKLDKSQTPVIGELMLRGSYNMPNANPPILYNFEERISIVTTVELEMLAFQVSQDSKTPKFYSNQVNLEQDLPDLSVRQSLTENSFVHVKFKIKFDQFKIQKLRQAFVRLRHEEYNYASHFIPAQYKEDRIEYTATIDLGDPDHVLAKSA